MGRDQENGVSLFELLIAIIIVPVSVMSMSVFFPKVYHSIIASNYRQHAKSIAATAMQEVKEKPYQYLIPNLYTDFPVGTNPAAGGKGCDCNSWDMLSLPAVSTVVNGITYQQRQCINLVNRATSGPDAGTWIAYCPDTPLTPGDPNTGTGGTDFGLKNIRILVTWTLGSSTQSLELESVVNRQ